MYELVRPMYDHAYCDVGALQLRRPTSPNPKCYAYYERS